MTTTMSFTIKYLWEMKQIIDGLCEPAEMEKIEKMVGILNGLRETTGRLFILGVGGSAGTASHAVNDFRKLVGIESYAPTDNVSELTARTNDEGWETTFVEWLKESCLNRLDAVLVLSVGGGNIEKYISPNLVKAILYAKDRGAKVLGIVGRDGGYTATVADACIIVPTVNKDHVTPHTEAFHSAILHLLVTHPLLKAHDTKWERVTR